MSVADLARPEIRALEPYEAAVQVANTIRLNANEAPWTAESDAFRRPLNRYPEIRPARLRTNLASRYGCAENALLVTRGSSEAIDLLIRVFCRAGVDNIVTTGPTFSMYRHYAEIQGAEVREVATSPDTDFSIDADEVLAACDDNSRLIFLCSPNNPTGTLLETEALEQILSTRGDRSAVVLDEAYIEFAGRESAIGLLDRYPNLVVLRTLSKALACAGARCGAVIGPPDVIRMINAVQAPYAIATPVVETVEDALDDAGMAAAEAAIATIIAERDRLMTSLARAQGVIRTWPSFANFFLIEVDDADALLEAASRNGILLRRFGGSLKDCVRISVGTPDENDRLLALFDAAVVRNDVV